jgi:hypothetical protein
MGSCLIFSSALRILEGVAPLQPCLTGRAEAAVFGFPLGDRTPYRDVFRIRESQWLMARDGALRSGHYSNWPDRTSAPASVDELYSVFQDAVDLRLSSHGDGRRPLAFLSGGLDSRAVVSQLLRKVTEVQAFNFSPPGSQDRGFASAFAAQFGSRLKLTHHQLPSYNFPRWSDIAREALSAESDDTPSSGLIWSGDGGSVGFGYVYLNRSIVSHAGRGDLQAATRELLDSNNLEVPNLVLRSRFRRQVRDLVQKNVLSELRRGDRPDAWRPYFFLLFNDQRRHLGTHFEDIDQHRLEFQLPFFDAEFLKAVATLSAGDCVGHAAYMRWFQRFPETAYAVPWQTYPGHEPCAVDSPGTLSNQWENGTGKAAAPTRDLARARAALATLEMESEQDIFRPVLVRAAMLLHKLGFGDYAYVIDWIETLAGCNVDRRL